MTNMPFNPQMFGQYMQNPIQFLLKRRINIPQDLQNNPKGIVQHLMNTGQMNQQTFNYLDGFRKEFENRLNGNANM